MSRTWFITGCSSGLGRAMAEAVIETGDRLVLTARREQDIIDISSRAPDRILPLAVDITNETQVREALATAVNRFGRLDIVVNNAGCGLAASIEEATDAEWRSVYETNIFGTMNVTRHAASILRKQGSGHIVFVSSIGALVGLAGTGVYGSSKASLDAIAEVLHRELAPFGVKVSSILPGVFRTEFRRKSLSWTSNSIAAYDSCRPAYQSSDQPYPAAAADPAQAGQALINLVNDEQPPLRLPLGADALEALKSKISLLERDLAKCESLALAFGSQDPTLLIPTAEAST